MEKELSEEETSQSNSEEQKSESSAPEDAEHSHDDQPDEKEEKAHKKSSVKTNKTAKDSVADESAKTHIDSADMASGDKNYLLDIAPTCDTISLTKPWFGQSPFVERLLQRLDPHILKSLSLNTSAHPQDIRKFLTGTLPNLEVLLLNVGEHSYLEEQYAPALLQLNLPKLRELHLLQALKWSGKSGEAVKVAFPIIKPILQRFASTLEVVSFYTDDPLQLTQLLLDTPGLTGSLDSITKTHLCVSPQILRIDPASLSEGAILHYIRKNVVALIEDSAPRRHGRETLVNAAPTETFDRVIELLLGPEPPSHLTVTVAAEIMQLEPFSNKGYEIRGTAVANLHVINWCLAVTKEISKMDVALLAPMLYRGVCFFSLRKEQLNGASGFGKIFSEWNKKFQRCVELDALTTIQAIREPICRDFLGIVDVLKENTWADVAFPLNELYGGEPLWHHWTIDRPKDWDSFCKFLALPGLDLSRARPNSGETLLSRILTWPYLHIRVLIAWAHSVKKHSGSFKEADINAILAWCTDPECLQSLLQSYMEEYESLCRILDLRPPMSAEAVRGAIVAFFECAETAEPVFTDVINIIKRFPEFNLPSTPEEMEAIEGFGGLQVSSEYSRSVSNKSVSVAFRRIEKAKHVPGLLDQWLADSTSLRSKLLGEEEPEYGMGEPAPSKKDPNHRQGKTTRQDKKCTIS
jgi:hypothetical protein